MKYYLIAGEKSGDLHGANLIKALRKAQPEAQMRGFGGDLMQAAGLDLQKHYREMAFIGIVEVLANLPKILSLLRFCKRDILAYQPDVIIYIDYPGFNMRIAEFAKKKGFTNFYYISPKIWAWNRKRVYKIKRYIDRMFVILPFEQDFYADYDYEVDYVGNPLFDAISNYKANPNFITD
ncbi:MAG: lipid-A-disaccharide synthase, partial [Bernardetiaceae bacterium]|nr:lipid-A-disaccharide synthase [Bernardetiaceae bacterium]